MQNSKKRRFMDDECCSDMDFVKETAIAVFACVEMRDTYDARTAGTCVNVPLPAMLASYIQYIY